MELRRGHMHLFHSVSSTTETRSLWKTAFFSYPDGTWHLVQVTSDHVANHYTTLAHVTSIAPPTECSLAITFPSAQLSNKGGATTCPWSSLRNIKVHPGSSDPRSDWNTWEEYLKLKPGEFTPDQIVAEITQNRMEIDRTVARILKTFNWHFTSRLIAVIGWLGK